MDDNRHFRSSPEDRLLRHLCVAGALDPARPTAAERLAAELGEELLAVVQVALGGADSVLLRARSRRVA